MSHSVKVSFGVRDLNVFEQACTNLGAQFKRDQTRFRMFGSETQPCVHAVTVPGTTYEIGLRYATANDTTVFDAACDFFDGSLRQKFGENLVNLKNEYLAVYGETKLREQGYWVERQYEGKRLYLNAQI